METGEIYQQGDVILEKVHGLPKGVRVKPDDRGYVLAEGEVTGHCHKITEVENVVMVKTDGGQIYLSVKTRTPLKHDEHTLITIEPGDYRVRKVMERDHFSRITREVID